MGPYTYFLVENALLQFSGFGSVLSDVLNVITM